MGQVMSQCVHLGMPLKNGTPLMLILIYERRDINRLREMESSPKESTYPSMFQISISIKTISDEKGSFHPSSKTLKK